MSSVRTSKTLQLEEMYQVCTSKRTLYKEKRSSTKYQQCTFMETRIIYYIRNTLY